MSHTHHPHHDIESAPTGRIRSAFFLNAVFTIIELVGGILTNSVAILSDAVHDAGDTASLGLAWYLGKFSKKEGNRKYTYGYGRFSLLSAFINGLILISGSIFVLVEAVPRLINPEVANYKGMILLALLGVIFNGIAALRVRGNHSMNEKMVFWHLMEDVGGWVIVLISSIIMLFANAPILDPLVSVLFTGYILYNVLKNFLSVSRIFMQKSPEAVNTVEIQREIEKLGGIKSSHDVHAWSLDGDEHILTIHVVVEDFVQQSEIPEIKKRIRAVTAANNIHHPTIEIELANEDCVMVDCT